MDRQPARRDSSGWEEVTGCGTECGESVEARVDEEVARVERRVSGRPGADGAEGKLVDCLDRLEAEETWAAGGARRRAWKEVLG